MLFKYKCRRCGETFERESTRRTGAKYCPECSKLQKKDHTQRYREKQIKLAFKNMINERK